MDLKSLIRTIPDFPEKGVNFRDITPLIRDADAFSQSIHAMADGPWHQAERTMISDVMLEHYDYKFDVVLSAEARGFFFGPPIALLAGKGFIPGRKPGKLPWHTISTTYSIEYSDSRSIEIHADAIQPGDRVLIVDDVFATGGTLIALADLVERAGGTVVGISTLIELTDLGGREAIARKADYPVQTLMTFTESE